jgi:tRNA-dihydrouridine synthase
MDVSIKTRIGRDSSAEFEDIIEIYKKYPISELIIHPRIQTDFYKNTPNMEVFAEGVVSYGRTDMVCYNGDINSVADYERFIGNYPDIMKVMIGRGMIADPCLAEWIKSTATGRTYDWNRFFTFHDELYRNYCESDVGRGNTMFKMKELWAYWSRLFVDMEGAERALKKIRKTRDNGEYEAAVRVLAALCR